MKATPRLAVTLFFIAFGTMNGSLVGAIPILRSQTQIDTFMFGLITALGTGATIVGMSFAGWLNRRFDHRTMMLTALPLAVPVLAVQLLVWNALSYFAVTFVYSLLMGLTDLFMNAEASVVERDLGKPVFSSFHAAVLYAIGLFGLLGSYVSVNYGAIWCLLPPLPFVALALWAVYHAIAHQPPEPEARVAKVELPYRLLSFIGLIVGLDVVCEQSCWAWAGQLLNEKAPALAAYSGLGVAFYGLCNGTARLFGDYLRARFDDMWLVGLSFLVAAVGFVILAFGTGFVVAVGAFAVAGAGLGLIYPCLVSVAARLAPDARAAALGYQAAVSGPARLGMPAIQGWVARGYGLNAIYGLAGAASLLAIAVTVFTAKAISKRSA